MKSIEGEFFRQPGTPLPWVLGKRIGNDWEFVVCASEGPLEVAPLFHDGTEENECGEANGKYIVEACNAYPELKAENDRLKRMAKLDYELVKEFDNYGTGGDLSTCLREMKMQISELRTALERARPHLCVGYSGIQAHEITKIVDTAMSITKRKKEKS